MNPGLKRAALSVCIVASLAAPVWAAEPVPVVAEPTASASEVKPAPQAVPSAVTVDGKAVTFDQRPVMKGGVLMVPVRAIAEAAGGTVTWDEAIKLIHIRMPDRTIMIRLDQQEAEMNQDGVYYLTRNLIKLEQMPALIGGRSMVSADALTKLFGFAVTTSADGTMALASPTKAPTEHAERGTITEVEQGDNPRVLIAGDLMANGERSLKWASITPQTKITVREGEQTRAGTVADLKVGPQVEITWAGPLLESYPARGTAAEIVVHK